MKLFGKISIAFVFLLTAFSAHASQYDGKWLFKIKTTVGANCSASSGNIVVSDGKFKGTIMSEGLRLRVRGKVSEGGAVDGKVGVGLARLTGKMKSSASGSGTWKNRIGCRGTFSLRKTG